MIGKTITGYEPTLNTSAQIQGGTVSDSGYSPKSDYAGSTSGPFTTESLDWKIWGIDDKNIYLISATPTSAKLTLKGSEGYNNGVYILNEICKTCYTNSKYEGVEVRSINAEDIKNVIKDTVQNENSDYDTTPYSNGYSFQYPNAYWTYDKNDELNNRHKQESIITGVLGSVQNHSPKSTYYYYSSSKLSNAESWTNGAYKDLYNPGDYWLASRFVNPNNSSGCAFGLQRVDSRLRGQPQLVLLQQWFCYDA